MHVKRLIEDLFICYHTGYPLQTKQVLTRVPYICVSKHVIATREYSFASENICRSRSIVVAKPFTPAFMSAIRYICMKAPQNARSSLHFSYNNSLTLHYLWRAFLEPPFPYSCYIKSHNSMDP